jgi:site-specific DNA recombinase
LELSFCSILQNALYVGRIIWNRQSFIKDPESGRRISRPNPKSEWMTADAPELRIIADELFDNVQKRRAERAGSAERHYASRPRRLLSGLLKCGWCRSGYVISGADKRGPYLRCSRMVETGLCGNRCTVGVDILEKRILEGIEKQLASPDLIAEYVREYHRAWTTLRDSARSRRAQLQKELRDIEADTKTTINMLMAPKNKALLTHLEELEKQREATEAVLADVVPPLIELHPNVGDIYRKKVRDLKGYLAATDGDNRAKAYRAIRELIQKVVIMPKGGAYQGYDIEIHGQLAALLEASQRGTMREPKSMGALVAGVGFEPTTFRL